jgi:hypothetical protein
LGALLDKIMFKEISLDSILYTINSFSLSLDAVLSIINLRQVTFDSVLLKTIIGNFSLDAMVVKHGIMNTTLLEAQLQSLFVINQQLDAILIGSPVPWVVLDALLTKISQQKLIGFDGWLYNYTLNEITLDSIFYETIYRQIGVDALILSGDVAKTTLMDVIIYSTLISAHPKYSFIVTNKKFDFKTYEKPQFVVTNKKFNFTTT